jgi:hypothetical protein
MAPEIRYDGVHCAFVIERPAPAVLVLRISGTDVGELGDAPMRGLDDHLAGASPAVIHRRTRDPRRFIALTADFVRRFAELEGVMRIYTDSSAFDAALNEAAAPR